MTQIEVRPAIDPAEPTPGSFNRLAVYRKEPGARGRTKTRQVAWLKVLPSVQWFWPYKDLSARTRFIFSGLPGERTTKEEREEALRQARALLPFLDRMWLIFNWERLSEDLARVLDAVNAMKDLPPGLKNKRSLTAPLAKIQTRLGKLAAEHDERKEPEDVPPLVRFDHAFQLRWAYEESGLPVPEYVQKQIAAMQGLAEKMREAGDFDYVHSAERFGVARTWDAGAKAMRNRRARIARLLKKR